MPRFRGEWRRQEKADDDRDWNQLQREHCEIERLVTERHADKAERAPHEGVSNE